MKKLLMSGLIGASLLAAVPMAQAQESPWMVRARAVNLNWTNGQSDGLGDVTAKDMVIPEVDVSYFFTKNIAAELVLTYPQRVKVHLDGADIGKVTALPPSLLLQYHFTNFGQFKPYIGAGINYTVFFDRKVAGDALQVDRSTFGYAAQVGFDYMMDKNWGWNVDLKYAQIRTDVTGVSDGVKAGRLDLSPTMVGVGLTYRFK